MLETLTLENVRNTAVTSVMGVISLFWGTSLDTDTAAPATTTAASAQTAAKAAVAPPPTISLTSRDIGQYARLSWREPGTTIEPGSDWDRVRDLNLAVAKQQLTDTLTDDVLDQWATAAQWGGLQQKKLLLQLNFWDGDDRFQGTLEPTDVYWNRLQLFLDGQQARNALPNYLGIVLAEENVHYSGRPQVLTTLYQRIKQKYAVNVFQWYSPYAAVPGSAWIPADGWVIDPYLLSNPQFRQYVRKYFITRTPVIVMPWASSDPTAYPPLTTAQWQANNNQLDVAVEYNLPVAFYWTKNGTTYFPGDRNNPTADEIGLMDQWVWKFITRAQALPANYAGLATADTGVASPLNTSTYIDSTGAFRYLDDFSTQKCIDDASISGFRDLVMNGQTLSAFGYQGRSVKSVLTYQFQGTTALRYPTFSVTGTVANTTGNRVELAVSVDGKNWKLVAATKKTGSTILTLKTSSREFAKVKNFWVRITMTGEPGTKSQPTVGIDGFVISGLKTS